ncbi:hypothetical protein [Pseudochryseolinea flava]|uniref:hypothetical protein n=1 Tax=Pseudochryseolinea flava TaxID=2059302 RepID=UPI00162AA88A|nr:hypothetical protein [Pseudochryseolinea flava]
MNKLIAFVVIVLFASLLGGVYGVVHDQLTYTVSHEYYTKFKFHQFALVNDGAHDIPPNARVLVSIVGFLATWWMGTFIGIILGAIALIFPTWQEMARVAIKAFSLTMVVAFVTGIVGLAYGYFVLGTQSPSAFEHWYLPNNLDDFRSFIAVGSMHNFSYLGGVLGLMVAKISIFIYYQRKRQLLKQQVR